MTEPCIVVVDPYSSGSLLFPEFRKSGYRCVGVRSTPEVPGLYGRSFDPVAVDEILPYMSSPEAVAATLRHQDVRHILPGCELGVDLAHRSGQRPESCSAFVSACRFHSSNIAMRVAWLRIARFRHDASATG